MNYIEIKGASVHNLKNLNIKIPKEKLTVVTGISGSGKTSLVYNTIYLEAQRRYVESISIHSRKFLETYGNRKIKSIKGLSPAISVDQKCSSRTTYSTIGTLCGIDYYIRQIYAHFANGYCPECRKKLEKLTEKQI